MGRSYGVIAAAVLLLSGGRAVASNCAGTSVGPLNRTVGAFGAALVWQPSCVLQIDPCLPE